MVLGDATFCALDVARVRTAPSYQQRRRTRRWPTITFKRRDEQERLDPHIDEARDSAGGAVGVDGREHQVSGKRRVDGKRRCLAVADLSHHDDVRVLAHKVRSPLANVNPISGFTCVWLTRFI